MFLSADFWPLFWGLIGGGAALTVLLSLLVATVPLARHRRRPPSPVTEGAPRHHEESRERTLVGAHK